MAYRHCTSLATSTHRFGYHGLRWVYFRAHGTCTLPRRVSLSHWCVFYAAGSSGSTKSSTSVCRRSQGKTLRRPRHRDRPLPVKRAAIAPDRAPGLGAFCVTNAPPPPPSPLCVVPWVTSMQSAHCALLACVGLVFSYECRFGLAHSKRLDFFYSERMTAVCYVRCPSPIRHVSTKWNLTYVAPTSIPLLSRPPARPPHGETLQCPPSLHRSRGKTPRRDRSRERDRGEDRSRSGGGGSRRDRKERGKETPPRRARERDRSRSSSSSSGSRSHSVPSHRWPKLRSRSPDRARDRQTRMSAENILFIAPLF